ncbi:hypothetical protein Htur_1378 [Haloterrigena turkmenica DSM 5511]|uniref:DUF4397 domain-containing protein n=1 Tax=Haloterrigena turkmenica (strain ATCC 51198 / DSM 5511 / JCM 9101 / NCIMB 13204 / VKM B-1734 / 4k) TaxID=543526 RepID=D2RQ07_HALTV|nr:DUF4397 domain-containing protein [Haloterrigena turkmenica]ADB60266.1 hypothetical protein Htur_1378 [Haloterrigena turkmenica DSM 5511]
MAQNHTRRRALSLIGSTGIVAIAGCTGGGGDSNDEEMSDDDGSNGEEMNNGTEDMNNESESDDMDEAMGNVRVAHLSPDAPNVDVWVDGDPALEDVPYRTVSDYLPLEPGTYAVEITAAGDPDTVVFDDDLEVGEGDYTVAAVGELAEENQPFEVAVFEDDLSDPGDQARIRLVHASPDAPAVDVTAGDGETVLFEGAAFGDAAAVEVPADMYTLEVRPATDGNDGDVVATFDVEPEAGTVSSAFAVGYLEPKSAPVDEPFDLEIVVDHDGDH